MFTPHQSQLSTPFRAGRTATAEANECSHVLPFQYLPRVSEVVFTNVCWTAFIRLRNTLSSITEAKSRRDNRTREGDQMKNVIISMIAKISKMDAEAKQLTARVEAQSLLLSALMLTIGKNGGVRDIIENVKKAINTAIDATESPLKSDAEMLLAEFTELLSVTRLLDDADTDIDYKSLNTRLSNTDQDDPA